jgi:hypothetical protein
VRASGRLLWVANYAIVLTALGLVITTLRYRVATTILIAGLVLQTIDLSPRYSALRHELSRVFVLDAAEHVDPLRSPFWNVAAKHYHSILLAPVANKPAGYEPLAMFAAGHAMTINAGYFTRVSDTRVADSNARVMDSLAKGTLQSDGLYVLWDSHTSAPVTTGPSDGAATIDGFKVVAPGWFNFADCCDQGGAVLAHANPSRPGVQPDLAIRVNFGQAIARRWMRSGWYQDETSGSETYTWSEGQQSVLELPLPVGTDVRMIFDCKPYRFQNGPRQYVSVVLNGTVLQQLSLDPERRRYDLVLPKSLVRPATNTLEFRYAYAQRPKDVEAGSEDTRALGVAWYAIELTPTGAP